MPDRENIRFNVLRNALYHTSRRRSFERWNRFFNFLVVVLGAAGVGNLLGRFGIGQAEIGVAVALVGAAQLVFDFAGASRTHQALQRDYYNLLGDIEEELEPTAEQLAIWYGKMVRIAGDEPPVLRALDAKAYNDAMGAMEYYPAGDRLHLPWYHRLLGRMLSYDGYNFKKISELPGYQEAPRIGIDNAQ